MILRVLKLMKAPAIDSKLLKIVTIDLLRKQSLILILHKVHVWWVVHIILWHIYICCAKFICRNIACLLIIVQLRGPELFIFLIKGVAQLDLNRW